MMKRIQCPFPAPHGCSGDFRRILIALTLLILTIGSSPAGTDSWPSIRGPWENGHAAAPGDSRLAGLPLEWSETRNVRWKQSIPHTGLSTPVVMGDQVWVTTATEAGNDFFVLCLDAGTGEVRFNERLFHSDDPESLGNGRDVNSYATPSAVIEPGRVYVHYGSFGTACIDTATFKVLWKRDDLPCRHYRGASSSPVLFGDLVILTFDGANLQYLAALDKKTGRTVWKTDRSVKWNDEHIDQPMVRDGDRRKAHGTPVIVQASGKTQILSVGAKAAYGYNPKTGDELWRFEFDDFSAAPMPVLFNDRMIMVSGFSKSEMFSVRTDGAGDVTATHVDWSTRTRVPRYASPIVVGDLIYIAADESFVSCLEAATGKSVWTERIGGKFRASPIYADGRLYFCNLEGGTTVLKPGRTFEVLATNQLGADDPPRENSKRPPGYMASPAVAGKALFLRTRDSLYRVESGSTAAR
ncbi:MAG: PQQ-binding-like beta-propeller repeat protein [Verrucomicrobia bacterium]|nr:PQQ-binding-like beta-propeller repeat protein [Verrucomicrobiota bacterium]